MPENTFWEANKHTEYEYLIDGERSLGCIAYEDNRWYWEVFPKLPLRLNGPPTSGYVATKEIAVALVETLTMNWRER